MYYSSKFSSRAHPRATCCYGLWQHMSMWRYVFALRTDAQGLNVPAMEIYGFSHDLLNCYFPLANAGMLSTRQYEYKNTLLCPENVFFFTVNPPGLASRVIYRTWWASVFPRRYVRAAQSSLRTFSTTFHPLRTRSPPDAFCIHHTYFPCKQASCRPPTTRGLCLPYLYSHLILFRWLWDSRGGADASRSTDDLPAKLRARLSAVILFGLSAVCCRVFKGRKNNLRQLTRWAEVRHTFSLGGSNWGDGEADGGVEGRSEKRRGREEQEGQTGLYFIRHKDTPSPSW